MTAVVTLGILAALLGGLAWLVLARPRLVTKGQDAAGQGMFSAFVAVLLMACAGGLAIAAIVVALVTWT